MGYCTEQTLVVKEEHAMTGSMFNGLVVMAKFLVSDVIVTPSSQHSKAVASAIATSGQGVHAIIVSAKQNLYSQSDQRKRPGLLD